MVITAPAQYTTVTNVNNTSNQVMLGTTDVFTFPDQPDGSSVAIGTGRNLVTDPIR